MKFGSVCSGIEAASLAFEGVNITPAWFSEIEDFPSAVLKHHYPDINNYGDMNNLPDLILNEQIEAPDILCGGTPCQAFSLAGWREGLIDDRGQLTLRFIDIADSIDKVRTKKGLKKSIIMWENVEGVLKDKTNAFGSFIAGLAGLTNPIEQKKWPNTGILHGNTRNVAWRVLDAKYFGAPQQRKRLFVIATDKNINPESILFEMCNYEDIKSLQNIKSLYNKNNTDLDLFSKHINDLESNTKIINNHKIEVFRQYTDCLYSAYGTKWNGNAAAYNGSLYISQNDQVRRLTPLECERIMGFPDNYTNLNKASNTSRYKALGNSWSVQTVKWLAEKISKAREHKDNIFWIKHINPSLTSDEFSLYLIDKDFISINPNMYINLSMSSKNIEKGNIFDIIDLEPSPKLYLSKKGSDGILRRKNEKNININPRLEELFISNEL